MTIDQDLIQELRQKVELAESHINHLEGMANRGFFPEGLDIPSVNELRYALYHVLKYLTGDSKGAHDALKHVHRAIYDCYETECLYQFANFQDFETVNQDIIMKDVFPKYHDWAREFATLQDFIRNTSKENRDLYYKDLEKMLAKVRPFPMEIFGVRQEILKVRAEKERQNSEKDRALKSAQESLKIAQDNLELARKTVAIRTRALIIGAFGAISAIAVAVLTYLKNSAPN